MEIALKQIRSRIAASCERAGRQQHDVKLVAVTKTVDADRITASIQAGIQIVGENRVQEALKKHQQVSEPASWHLIGHLQTNKVRKALTIFDCIHALDSEHLATRIQDEAARAEQTIDVLVQVNTSQEPSKFGLEPAALLDFMRTIASLDLLRIRGLMTIGAFTADMQRVRNCFVQLRELAQQARGIVPRPEIFDQLSMGMTNDFEIAIEEGATLIRVGRALFGER